MPPFHIIDLVLRVVIAGPKFVVTLFTSTSSGH